MSPPPWLFRGAAMTMTYERQKRKFSDNFCIKLIFWGGGNIPRRERGGIKLAHPGKYHCTPLVFTQGFLTKFREKISIIINTVNINQEIRPRDRVICWPRNRNNQCDATRSVPFQIQSKIKKREMIPITYYCNIIHICN